MGPEIFFQKSILAGYNSDGSPISLWVLSLLRWVFMVGDSRRILK